MAIKNEDSFGVQEYTTWFKVLLAATILYSYIAIAAYGLLLVEQSTGNIHSYKDAFWVLRMAASTIGFGDYYPVTDIGRNIVSATFYIGVGLTGFIATTIATKLTGFTDTNVQNRELRQQNDEIISLLTNQGRAEKLKESYKYFKTGD